MLWYLLSFIGIRPRAMATDKQILSEPDISRWAAHFRREIRREYPGTRIQFWLVEDPMDKFVTEGPKLTAQVTLVPRRGPNKVVRFMPEIPECWDPVLSECLDFLDGLKKGAA